MILFIFLGVFIFLNSDKSPILSKIEYSGAYADKNGDLMKVFLTSDTTVKPIERASEITAIPQNIVLMIELWKKTFIRNSELPLYFTMLIPANISNMS